MIYLDWSCCETAPIFYHVNLHKFFTILNKKEYKNERKINDKPISTLCI